MNDEDRLDEELWEQAYAEYKANPATFTLDDVETELGLL